MVVWLDFLRDGIDCTVEWFNMAHEGFSEGDGDDFDLVTGISGDDSNLFVEDIVNDRGNREDQSRF